jgi:hypothetical protein
MTWTVSSKKEIIGLKVYIPYELGYIIYCPGNLPKKVLYNYEELSFNELHGVITRKTEFFISTAVRISNPTYVCMP